MGNSATLPSDKTEEKIEGVDQYCIDVDLSDRTVLYDYLLQRKVRKENGKWKFEGYGNVGEKNKKETKQISLMYHFINYGSWLEKKVPKNEETEEADDGKEEIESEFMKQSFFRNLSQSKETNGIPYCVLPVYYPGETVRGKLRLKTTKTFNLEKIKLEFSGGAFTRYRVYHGRGYYDVFGKEKCVESKQTLWTKSSGFSEVKHNSPSSGDTLPPGEYEWSFEFHIPVDGVMPSVPCVNPSTTFFGFVGYRIKSVLDTGNFLNRGNVASCFGLWVEKESDVAINLENLSPVFDKKHQQTGLLNDGYIQLIVKLPKSGFVIGEDIPISVEIDNRSSGPVDCVEAKLLLSGKYLTGKSTFSFSKSFKHFSDAIVSGPISPGESPSFNWILKMVFSNTEIDEHLLPTSDLECGLIKLKYNLYVTAKRSGIKRDVELKVPIVIGNTNSKEIKTFSYLHDLNSDP